VIRTRFLLLAASFAALVACYVGPIDRGPAGNGQSTDGTEPGDENPSAEGEGEGEGAGPTGLPCDVDKLLRERCGTCHGANGKAPMPLVTYDDLKAPSKSDADKTTAVLSIERMRSASDPMPPSGQLASKEILVLEKWVAAGMPRGECGGGTTDAGKDAAKEAGKDSGSTGSVDAGKDSAPPITSVCTSGTMWTGTTKGPTMQPGKACITCHESADDSPVVWVGGTVYPTLHEPNGCYGINGGATVVITDAAGRVVNLPVGPTGNFSLSAKTSANLTMPYKAKVVRNGVTRAMATPQSTGNCNGCHTENGASGAPGRILVP